MLLKTEYLPQKTLFIDNVPAYLAGEWPGIKGSKWTGSKLIINQVRDASFTNPNPSLPSLGRRHYKEKLGDKEVNFGSKKLISYLPHVDKPRGLRRLVQQVNEPREYQFRKLTTPGKIEKDKEVCSGKRVYPDKYELFTKEYTINDELGRKKRLSDLLERRNGMPVRAPGDKNIKNPEWGPGYFKEGGLVVGSTNSFNYKKTLIKGNNNFFDTLDLKVKTIDDKNTWEYKQRLEDLNYQTDYVKSLNQWEESVIGKIDEAEKNEKDEKSKKEVKKKK